MNCTRIYQPTRWILVETYPYFLIFFQVTLQILIITSMNQEPQFLNEGPIWHYEIKWLFLPDSLSLTEVIEPLVWKPYSKCPFYLCSNFLLYSASQACMHELTKYFFYSSLWCNWTILSLNIDFDHEVNHFTYGPTNW